MKPLYIKKNGIINKVGGIGMPTSYPASVAMNSSNRLIITYTERRIKYE